MLEHKCLPSSPQTITTAHFLCEKVDKPFFMKKKREKGLNYIRKIVPFLLCHEDSKTWYIYWVDFLVKKPPLCIYLIYPIPELSGGLCTGLLFFLSIWMMWFCFENSKMQINCLYCTTHMNDV